MTRKQRESMIAFHKRMAKAYTKEGQHQKAANALQKVRDLQVDLTGWDASESVGVVTDTNGNLLEHY